MECLRSLWLIDSLNFGSPYKSSLTKSDSGTKRRLIFVSDKISRYRMRLWEIWSGQYRKKWRVLSALWPQRQKGDITFAKLWLNLCSFRGLRSTRSWLIRLISRVKEMEKFCTFLCMEEYFIISDLKERSDLVCRSHAFRILFQENEQLGKKVFL